MHKQEEDFPLVRSLIVGEIDLGKAAFGEPLNQVAENLSPSERENRAIFFAPITRASCQESERSKKPYPDMLELEHPVDESVEHQTLPTYQGYFILGLGDDFSWFQPSDAKFSEV